MKKIYLDFLVEKKNEKRLSYEDMESKVNMSKSKLQRIFTGQADPSITDLEDIVEKALGARMRDLYARVGEQELAASAELDFKGAQALLEDFNVEKNQIRMEYQTRIDQLMVASDERQKAFTFALKQAEEQYHKNLEYLTDQVHRQEDTIVEWAARASRAEEIAAEAQRAAKEADAERRDVKKNRYHVFAGMLCVIVVLAAVLAFIVIANVPQLGGGNV